MKTPGEAAMDLRWIAPSVASMTALARSPLASIWTQLRTDPGIVLLYARLPETDQQSPTDSLPSDISILETILQHRTDFDRGFADWSQPGEAGVHNVCCAQASLASRLAEQVGADPRQAWIGGFLAPLGWLAVAGAEPDAIPHALETLQTRTDSAAWQREAWGCDHAAIARRLSRRWRLPAWLGAIVGHLGLHANIAERLGADRRLFQIVQLAVSLVQERDGGLGLPVGAEPGELLAELNLKTHDVETLADMIMASPPSPAAWESPARHPLLIDLLEMALEQRRRNDAAWIQRLQTDLDRMQDALVQQSADEKNRLQTLKVSALAEFAAGAGHEINNPLAVISGQAQYVLKQLDWLDVPAEEIEDVALYLKSLREKVAPSLKKIIGQTQRIHSILTDLMQFARPSPSKMQTLSARSVTLEVAESLQALALQRKVRLITPVWDHDEYLHADAGQVRFALSALLRNAIEAAPADGWATLRVEKPCKLALDLIVEDNGAGPCAKIREHLFDPFFSGRSAGRGRGMGLPIAWRLARQQGGDVRFDGAHDGITRFVLTLPLALAPTYLNGNGHHAEAKIRHAAHSLQEAHL